ncbi:MAG: hypothetical protein JSS40_05360 [Proteobacteria bacterium]|nr:hypothetical protein [Pseudomonadota bacterium]
MLCALLAAPVLPTNAQSRPDPTAPGAPVPAAAYRSAFAGYRGLGDEPVGDWRAANDEVRRIGGWREYAREAQSPEEKPGAAPPAKAAPAGPAAPAEGALPGHGHHGVPGGKQ